MEEGNWVNTFPFPMSHWLTSRTTRSKEEEMNMGIDLRDNGVGDCRVHVSIILS